MPADQSQPALAVHGDLAQALATEVAEAEIVPLAHQLVPARLLVGPHRPDPHLAQRKRVLSHFPSYRTPKTGLSSPPPSSFVNQPLLANIEKSWGGAAGSGGGEGPLPADRPAGGLVGHAGEHPGPAPAAHAAPHAGPGGGAVHSGRHRSQLRRARRLRGAGPDRQEQQRAGHAGAAHALDAGGQRGRPAAGPAADPVRGAGRAGAAGQAAGGAQDVPLDPRAARVRGAGQGTRRGAPGDGDGPRGGRVRAVRRAASAEHGRPAGAGQAQPLAGQGRAEAVRGGAGGGGAGPSGAPRGAAVGAAGEPRADGAARRARSGWRRWNCAGGRWHCRTRTRPPRRRG